MEVFLALGASWWSSSALAVGWRARALISVNLAAAILNLVDKSAARARRWRVSEKTLLLLELVGGLPGSMAMQNVIRHKTRSPSYQNGRALVVCVQLALICCWLAR